MLLRSGAFRGWVRSVGFRGWVRSVRFRGWVRSVRFRGWVRSVGFRLVGGRGRLFATGWGLAVVRVGLGAVVETLHGAGEPLLSRTQVLVANRADPIEHVLHLL